MKVRLQINAHTHLVECCHSLGELGFDLRQRLGPLQGLLQLLLCIVQALLELPVLLFALREESRGETRRLPRAADMIKATGGKENALIDRSRCQHETWPSCQSTAETWTHIRGKRVFPPVCGETPCWPTRFPVYLLCHGETLPPSGRSGTCKPEQTQQTEQREENI